MTNTEYTSTLNIHELICKYNIYNIPIIYLFIIYTISYLVNENFHLNYNQIHIILFSILVSLLLNNNVTKIENNL